MSQHTQRPLWGSLWSGSGGKPPDTLKPETREVKTLETPAPYNAGDRAEKRTRSVKIRLSDDELAILKMHSTRTELARWMREFCLSGGQQDLAASVGGGEKADPELLRQLAAVGNNLNQIARALNGGAWGALDKVSVLAALSRVEDHLKMIRFGQ